MLRSPIATLMIRRYRAQKVLEKKPLTGIVAPAEPPFEFKTRHRSGGRKAAIRRGLSSKPKDCSGTQPRAQIVARVLPAWGKVSCVDCGVFGSIGTWAPARKVKLPLRTFCPRQPAELFRLRTPISHLRAAMFADLAPWFTIFLRSSDYIFIKPL